MESCPVQLGNGNLQRRHTCELSSAESHPSWTLAIGYFITKFDILLGVNNNFLFPTDCYDLSRTVRIAGMVYQPPAAGR